MSHLSFSVTPAATSVKLLLRSQGGHLGIFQRGPQQHPSYQASSEGGMLSSGPPAPLEVQTFTSTDVYIENGKTAII